MADLFDGIEEAPVTYGSNYIKAGRYLAFIRSVVKGENHLDIGYVAIRLTILHTINSEESSNSNQPGEHVAEILKKDKHAFLSNVKSFIAGAFGTEPNSIEKSHVHALIPKLEDTAAPQPMAGIVIELNGVDAIAQKSGKPYVRKSFLRPVSADEVFQKVSSEDLQKYLSKTEYEILKSTLEEPDA